MRILYLSHWYPPEGIAGVEQYTHRLARGLQRRGADVRVLCATDWGKGSDYFNGARVDEFEGVCVRRLAYNWTKAPRPFDWLYDNPHAAEQVDAVVRAWRPDVAHVTSCYTLSARPLETLRRHDVPVVLYLPDYWFICARHTLQRWDESLCSGPDQPVSCVRCILGTAAAYRWARRAVSERIALRLFDAAGRVTWLTRRRGLRGMVGDHARRRAYLLRAVGACEAVIAPSQFIKRAYVANGVRADHIRVMRRGFEVVPEADPQPRPDGRLRVGYLGQVIPQKGVHLLVDAVRELGVELAVHGPLDVDAAYVRQLRVRAGNADHITLQGPYAHADLTRILAELDVIVVPSLWHENSPTVISEAFAVGIPVVASNLGGLPELVRDGVDGVLFDPRRPDALRDVLRRMMEDPSVLERLRRGVQPPRRLDEELDELSTLYRTMVAAQDARGRRAYDGD